jgi:methyl coenzyme M reductase beta subunit
MQHQVQVIASARAVATLANPIGGMQTQYATAGRVIAVYAYEAGVDHQKITALANAETDQVTTALRNVLAQRIAQIVFDAAVAAGAMPIDVEPLSLFEPGHILGMTVQVSEIQVSYLPIYAAEIQFETAPSDAESTVVMGTPADTAVGFVPESAEAA